MSDNFCEVAIIHDIIDVMLGAAVSGGTSRTPVIHTSQVVVLVHGVWFNRQFSYDSKRNCFRTAKFFLKYANNTYCTQT